MKAGWEVKRLVEVADFVMGQAPAGKDCNKEGIGTPFVKAGEFGESRPVIREWTTDPKKMATSSDVLICVVGATCGKINLGADCAIGRSAAAIRPDPKKLDQFYLHYFLEGKVQEFRAGSLGAAQTVISKNMLSEMPFPIPPLEEQKRIVAVLDAAFEGLTRAKENARANLQNARELFESTLSFIFSKSDDWCVSGLNDYVKFMDYRGKTPPKREAGVRLITAKNVKRGYIQVEPKEFIDEGAYDGWMTRGFPVEGDVLFTTEAPLANVAQLDTSEKVVIGQRLITMKADKTKIDPEFLKFSLMSPQVQEEIFSFATGATVLGIKAKLLKTVVFKFPISLEDQQNIAMKCRTSFEKMDELSDIYQTKLTDIADLRQSLLQKAFAGELT